MMNAQHRPAKRIIRLRLCVSCLLAIALFTIKAQAQMLPVQGTEHPAKPNILVVISDQLNWDFIAAAGNKYVKTPNMDRLCGMGVRFDRAYTINPVCIPARISLLTGKRPGMFGVHVPKEAGAKKTDMIQYVREKKVATRLQQSGYKTYYGGKTHFGPRGYEFLPEDMGFEVYASEREYRGEDCVPKAIETLDKHRKDNSGQPFFMITSLMNPHDICYAHIKNNRFDMEKIMSRTKGGGWKAKLRASVLRNLEIPEGYPGAGGYEPVDYYLSQAPPLPDNYLPQRNEPGIISGKGEAASGMAAAFGRYRNDYDSTDWLLHRYAYCRFVEDVDRELGQLLDGLEASGMAENTFIIFTSDHGEQLGSHQMAGKGLFFDEVCHVPFIVSHPGIEKARVDTVNLLSNGLDLLPSVFELAGAPPDPDWEGKSIVPLLHTASARLNRTAVPVEFSTGLGMVTRDFYYGIYVSGKTNHEQLYDIRKRPLQMENDALLPACAPALKNHRDLFRRTHQQTLEGFEHPEGFLKYIRMGVN